MQSYSGDNIDRAMLQPVIEQTTPLPNHRSIARLDGPVAIQYPVQHFLRLISRDACTHAVMNEV
jgi:hypothetical protein